MKIVLRGIGCALVALLLVSSFSALAGETGSVSGKVVDAGGAPLPGVLVKISGPQLPAGRTMSTSATGAYNFQQLIPGQYTVAAELQGLGKAAKTLVVQVDIDYQISLSLKGATSATAEVVGTSVDAKSTEVSQNFQSSEIRTLPISRTYEGLISLIPGASAGSGNGYVSVAGGTRQDNKYLIDGVNITNPGYGYLGVSTNELDIADVNIKTGAISAEFGRTSGAIVNAVTKSGTNEVHGTVRGEMSPSGFQSANANAIQQDVSTYNGAAGVGFPILKDALFGYVSGRYASSTTTGQSATIGDVTTTQPDSKATAGDYFGKLTGYIGQSFLINAGFRGLPNSSNGFNSAYDAASAEWNSNTTNYVWNVTADWFISKNAFLEAKYVHMTENDTYQAVNVLAGRPSPLPQVADLGAYGAFANLARNSGNTGVYAFANGGEAYRRDEIKLTASQFLDIGPTQHQIKVGGGAEFTDYDFIRQSNGWGTMTLNTSTKEIRARYYDLQPKQLGQTRTYSAFIQDTITWNRLSLNLGVLTNYDDFSQTCKAGLICGTTIAATTTRFNFMTFRWNQQFQPRLGIVYNAELLKGDKFYANYGEYAGLDQKSTVRSFAPYRIREDETYFSAATGQYLRDNVRGSSGGKVIPSDLPAPYQQEIVVGYAAPFMKDFSFDVYYQYRNLKNPFEDTPIYPNTYTSSSFMAQSYPDARRVYRGLSLDITKRYSNGWYANLNYTYSTLKGNWDEDQAVGSFNTSSYLEDEPGINSAEANRYGTLGQDRPHIFKLMGSYDLPAGFQVGGFLRVQSGTAWEARGSTWSTTNLRYLEPAGSRRLPTWTNFDFLAAWNYAFSNGMSVRLEGRVANLFNSQTVVGVNQILYKDGYQTNPVSAVANPQGTTLPNENFGVATSWASPRRFVLSALFNF